MFAKIEYRIFYKDFINLDYSCYCFEDRCCPMCEERESCASQWYYLPFYTLPRDNPCIPKWGMADEEKLYDILEDLLNRNEDDEEYFEAQVAAQVVQLFIKEANGKSIEFRWD